MHRRPTILAMSAGVLALASPGPAAAEALVGGGETASLAVAIVKVVVSLAIVIALLVAVVALLRKTGIGQGAVKGGRLINVIETRMIAPKKYVAVVEIGGEVLALGITDQQITPLATLADTAVAAAQSGGRAAQPFSSVLQRAASVVATGKKDGGEG